MLIWLMLTVEELTKNGLTLESAHEKLQMVAAIEFIEKLSLKGTERVADIGSGPGNQAFAFHALGCDVTCIDYNKPKYDFLKWLAPDSEGLDGSFDIVWSHHCLEHIPNPIAALIAWRRLLRKNGKLALTVPEIGFSMSSGHLNSYNIPLLMYHLAIAGFSTAGKTFVKRDSHLRAYVQKVDHYDPEERYITDLRQLAALRLFPPSVTKAIEETGRFKADDIHLNWFGSAKSARAGASDAHTYLLNSIWV